MKPVFQVIKGWGERERRGQPFRRGNGDVSKWSLLASGIPAPGSLSAGNLHYFLGRSRGLQLKSKCNFLLLERTSLWLGDSSGFLPVTAWILVTQNCNPVTGQTDCHCPGLQQRGSCINDKVTETWHLYQQENNKLSISSNSLSVSGFRRMPGTTTLSSLLR